MLYGQLQERHLSLIRGSSVSGAMTYQELCMAAKQQREETDKIEGL